MLRSTATQLQHSAFGNLERSRNLTLRQNRQLFVLIDFLHSERTNRT